jgi:hypothetical protein
MMGEWKRDWRLALWENRDRTSEPTLGKAPSERSEPQKTRVHRLA